MRFTISAKVFQEGDGRMDDVETRTRQAMKAASDGCRVRSEVGDASCELL